MQTVAALDAKDKNVLFAIREASETVPKLPGGAGGDDAKWLSDVYKRQSQERPPEVWRAVWLTRL